MATILIPGDSHLANFNKSRHSRHTLVAPCRPRCISRFYESRYGNLLQGISTWNPFRYDYDLIHSFNEIPLTRKPWIGTFESYIPRTIGKYDRYRQAFVRKLLLQDNCIKLISPSKYGAKQAEYWNKDWSLAPEMMKKVEIIHPSVSLKAKQPKQHHGQAIRIIFCGRAFAQKGGIVALRLAKLAHKSGFPLQVDIVSSLGNGWTDAADKNRYAADFELFNLPNVIFHGELPNQDVIGLFASRDFQLLATLHDTYGYSILEGFSVGTPAIVTATCALPEFVHPDENGFLLSVDVDELNEIKWLGIQSNIWNRIEQGVCQTDEYWDQQDRTFTDFAKQTFERLQLFLENPSEYERLSHNAIVQVKRFHNAEVTSRYLDDLYENSIKSFSPG